MPVTFAHVESGRTVTVPAPDDEPVRRVRQRAMRIRRLDAHPLWERADDSEPPAGDEPQPEPEPEPHPSDVRAWAKAEGLDVKQSGPLPKELVERYKEAVAADSTDRWDDAEDQDEPDEGEES